MFKNLMSNGFVFMLSSQESHDHILLDIPVTREQMNHYRAAAETAQSELAALSVKYDCAQSEVYLKILLNPSPNLRILCSHFLQRIESLQKVQNFLLLVQNFCFLEHIISMRFLLCLLLCSRTDYELTFERFEAV